MQYYSPQFSFRNNNVHSTKAHQHESLKKVIASYAEFVQECDNFSYEKPAPLYLYAGTLNGDESTFGYPDYPDRILSVGKRGAVVCSNI